MKRWRRWLIKELTAVALSGVMTSSRHRAREWQQRVFGQAVASKLLAQSAEPTRGASARALAIEVADADEGRSPPACPLQLEGGASTPPTTGEGRGVEADCGPGAISSHDVSAVSYITNYGSEIRDLLHLDIPGDIAQFPVEAAVVPGRKTLRHQYRNTEVIYHYTANRPMQNCSSSKKMPNGSFPGSQVFESILVSFGIKPFA